MPRRSVPKIDARALLGVIALYGMLLQAFLSGAAPLAPTRLVHELCLAVGGSSAPSPDLPVRHDHACCLVGHVELAASPPQPAAMVRLAPAPPALVAWRPEAAIPKTGPPTHAQSARGPPLA